MLTAVVVTFAVLKKEAEDALRQSETQYRLRFDSNPLPMWVFERRLGADPRAGKCIWSRKKSCAEK
jgi:PAS domain-containing protein